MTSQVRIGQQADYRTKVSLIRFAVCAYDMLLLLLPLCWVWLVMAAAAVAASLFGTKSASFAVLHDGVTVS
jgi:hypothetical protein